MCVCVTDGIFEAAASWVSVLRVKGAAEIMPLGSREPRKSQGTHGSLSPDFFHHSRGKNVYEIYMENTYTTKGYN